MTLHRAAEFLDEAAARADLRADPDAARRLGTLRDRVLEEAEYTESITVGMPTVRRRTDTPTDVALGWYLRHCATTRANRRVLGIDAKTVQADLRTGADAPVPERIVGRKHAA